MRRSTDRILTTHVGSLFRSQGLLDLYGPRQRGEPYDQQAFEDVVRRETDDLVRKQAEIGIDVPSDGEPSRFSFNGYLYDRISGIERRPVEPGASVALVTRDRQDFAGFYAQAAPHYWSMVKVPPTRTMCVGPITYNPEQAQRDVANFKAALQPHVFADAFFSAQTPLLGRPPLSLVNEYYRTQEELQVAFADAAHAEYKLLTDAGFVVQIDDPFLVWEWETYIPPTTVEEYRKQAERRVEILNYTLRDIPEEMVRFHICWGSWHGPHNHDLPLKDIVDIMLRIRTQAYSIEAANPQHEHEWAVWENTKLPEGKLLIPGVVTHKSYVIEHPDLVAQRLVRYAKLVGKVNVIAGADCGFGGRIHEELGWAKFRALVEGARRASQELWTSERRVVSVA